MDRNLGASRVPEAIMYPPGYGDLFQWGRLDDSHQDRHSKIIPGPVDKDVPGHENFITVSGFPWDWRLPTDAELDAEHQSWGSNDLHGAYASALKWSVSGNRTADGTLSLVNSIGKVWNSSVNQNLAGYIYYDHKDAKTSSFARVLGKSVRCVRSVE